MIREGYDDYRRHKQDQVENNKECLVLRGVWTKMKWESLKVGDFVSIKTKEWIPADLLLLHSKGEDGICYVETAALDGETNLKQRQALRETNLMLNSPEALAKFQGTVEVEPPNPDLYNFDGSITISHEKTLPLTQNQILLRGTILRNTPGVYGMVIYAGEETKLRMNASKNIRTKAPTMQRILNRVIIMVFSFVVFLSILYTIMSSVWEKQGINRWYTEYGVNPTTTFFGFVIVFNTMIPISLYVTMEIIKLAQVYFINNDRSMYHEETDTPAEARTSTLNEELGQVSYIFSDKTGTLTENIMILRKLSVHGKAFCHDSENFNKLSEGEPSASTPPKKEVSPFLVAPSTNLRLKASSQSRKSLCDVNFSMIAPIAPSHHRCNSLDSTKSTKVSMKTTMDLLNLIRHQPNSSFGRGARFFLLSVALCHTCVTESDMKTGEIFYQASSPDEFALLMAAKELGYVFINRSLGTVSLRFNDIPDDAATTNDDSTSTGVYKVLNVLEFSSERKRMSVIYQLPDGRICLLCKGADNVVLERLKENLNEKGSADNECPEIHQNSHHRSHDGKWLLEKTRQHIQDFSIDGLRTLLYAHRYIDKEEYDRWNELFQEASNSVTERRGRLEKVAELIETDLKITGATGIEDRLQNGVPETIESLRTAGIKVWMLTGDKRETATNIGYSCSLIKNHSIIINIDLSVNLSEMLEKWLKDVRKGRVEHVVAIIDGKTLMSIEQESDLLDIFVELCVLCETVICCRVNSGQKALVVQVVRRKLKDEAVTLAIGDGGNDIAMIQEAHVGIGITGREGLQAARASDYSIAQFRFLENLLFVHGRWSYVRISKFVLGTFYKCTCFYSTQGIFQIFTGFSGTSLYEQWTLAFYNTLFSSLPVLVIGIFEKDLNEKTLLSIPELYRRGQRNMEFNVQTFLAWMLGGLYHASVIVLVPTLLHEYFVNNQQAQSPQLFEFNSVCMRGIRGNNKNCVLGMPQLDNNDTCDIIPNIIHVPVYSVKGTFQNLAVNPKFWVLLLLTVSTALIPSLIITTVRKMVMPSDVDFYQEVEKDEKRLEDDEIDEVDGKICEKIVVIKNEGEEITKRFA
ncbi:17296_t:CDS:2 [Acaulospora colombiana]|uniref:17296_t:CDS:1 n=1 Tax=Acaulospora colombiana TaxID=27376 RepID=A0ACA9KXQ6_9GLOM|nr:17296_t:CDS:2 [Acaulospora colombiana]